MVALPCRTATRNHSPLAGFTLVELSIVLVIIALLAGGIIAGRNLIRAAELRNINVEYNSYLVAIDTFKDQFNALPGDMPNAGQIWGYANTSGTGGNCSSPETATGSVATLTCDGNGDGRVGIHATYYENYRFWQHLANAGLINGTYSGIQDGSVPPIKHGFNTPTSKLAGSGWSTARYLLRPAIAGSPQIPAETADILFFSGDRQSNQLPAEDAWNIDRKFDDGIPNAGKIFGQCDGFVGSATTTDYSIRTADRRCGLGFRY